MRLLLITTGLFLTALTSTAQTGVPVYVSPQFKEVLSIQGPIDEPFIEIGDVAVDKRGAIYVTDGYGLKVRRFSPDGTTTGEFGGRGSGKSEFQSGPYRIDCLNDTLAVVDAGSSEVRFFTKRFTFARSIQTTGPVLDVAFTCSGDIWIAAATLSGKRSEPVRRYGKSGQVLSEVGVESSEDGSAFTMVSLAADKQGHLVVLYRYRNKIEVYDSMGRNVSKTKVEGLPERAGRSFQVSGDMGAIPEGEIFRDVSIGADAKVYVLGGMYSSHPNRDVYVLDIHGNLLTELTLPAETGLLYIDGKGFFYTRESKRTVLKKYAVTGIGKR